MGARRGFLTRTAATATASRTNRHIMCRAQRRRTVPPTHGVAHAVQGSPSPRRRRPVVRPPRRRPRLRPGGTGPGGRSVHHHHLPHQRLARRLRAGAGAMARRQGAGGRDRGPRGAPRARAAGRAAVAAARRRRLHDRQHPVRPRRGRCRGGGLAGPAQSGRLRRRRDRQPRVRPGARQRAGARGARELPDHRGGHPRRTGAAALRHRAAGDHAGRPADRHHRGVVQGAVRRDLAGADRRAVAARPGKGRAGAAGRPPAAHRPAGADQPLRRGGRRGAGRQAGRLGPRRDRGRPLAHAAEGAEAGGRHSGRAGRVGPEEPRPARSRAAGRPGRALRRPPGRTDGRRPDRRAAGADRPGRQPRAAHRRRVRPDDRHARGPVDAARRRRQQPRQLDHRRPARARRRGRGVPQLRQHPQGPAGRPDPPARREGDPAVRQHAGHLGADRPGAAAHRRIQREVGRRPRRQPADVGADLRLAPRGRPRRGG